ncbi:MAG: DUF4160 domain-containing protein [Nitrincola lacisaponensis]|uniref:DUF4160 domain-containing protein n=1 Tax=Nitrincola lacisaponensis TaxID=267850 RepID=UPI00391A6EF6
MPTLLNKNGFKIFFYANEHPPAHVHVIKGNGWAKIELVNLSVVYSSLKQQELKSCLEVISEHEKEFLEAWYEWFGR